MFFAPPTLIPFKKSLMWANIIDPTYAQIESINFGHTECNYLSSVSQCLFFVQTFGGHCAPNLRLLFVSNFASRSSTTWIVRICSYQCIQAFRKPMFWLRHMPTDTKVVPSLQNLKPCLFNVCIDLQ